MLPGVTICTTTGPAARQAGTLIVLMRQRLSSADTMGAGCLRGSILSLPIGIPGPSLATIVFLRAFDQMSKRLFDMHSGHTCDRAALGSWKPANEGNPPNVRNAHDSPHMLAPTLGDGGWALSICYHYTKASTAVTPVARRTLTV